MTTKPKKKAGKQAAGSRRSYFMYSPFECLLIGVDKHGSDHPKYDARVLLPLTLPKLAATIKSIKKRGVRMPVAFTRDGKDIIIEEGRQRVRCAREAVRQLIEEGILPESAADPKSKDAFKIPAIPWQGGDDREMYIIAREMNALRVDDDAQASADIAERLRGWGKSEAEIADHLGVTTQTLKEWSALKGARPSVRNAMKASKMSATAGAKLAKLSSAEQDTAVAKLLDGTQKPTVAAAKNQVRAAAGKGAVETPAQKLKRVRDALADHDRDIRLTEEHNEIAQAFVSRIRKIVAQA